MKKAGRKLKKICPFCGHKMIKYGTAKSGNQIWRCNHCSKSKVFKRKDIKNKKWIERYIDFVLCIKTIKDFNCSRSNFDFNTSQLKYVNIAPPPVLTIYKQIHVDGIRISKCTYYLIASDGKYVISWHKCKSECAKTWVDFLRIIPAPNYVVSDGQKGLMFALDLCWNHTKIQRCQFHVMLNCRQKLTLNPQTEMGKELKYLVSLLNVTNTPNKVKAWGNYLFMLGTKFKSYLQEKTYQENGKWEYTHRRDRSCYYQLVKLFKSGELFRYVYELGFKVGRTSNSIEGGINSRIKDLIRRHRGADDATKCKIVELYLLTRVKGVKLSDLPKRFR